MTNRRAASALLLSVTAAGIITGCGSVLPAHYVPLSDPVLGVCQQPTVLNLYQLDQVVDSANNNNPSGGSGGLSMSPKQQSDLASTAKQLTADALIVQPLHPVLATAFRYESSLLILASQANGGLTTNNIAVSLDSYTSEIDRDCASYQAGTPVKESSVPAPKPTHSGLPVGDQLLLEFGSYWLVAIISGFLLARFDRRFPRDKRHTGNQLLGLSLLWPVALGFAIIEAWRDSLGHATLTSLERREDELMRANAALEVENHRLRELQNGDS